MAQHGKLDQANNSPNYVAAQFNKVANTGNQTTLFGNTTADAFVTGKTVAVVGVDDNEVRANSGMGIAHSGWHIKTTGSGGRAGRIHYECLVAGGITSDASDDALLPDYILRIITQPEDAEVEDGANATFTVVAASQPTGATLTYTWQFANGTALTANASYAGVNTASLTVVGNSTISSNSYKVVVQATGATNVTSTNASITVA